jgi:hypothetical protein
MEFKKLEELCEMCFEKILLNINQLIMYFKPHIFQFPCPRCKKFMKFKFENFVKIKYRCIICVKKTTMYLLKIVLNHLIH